MAQGNFDPNFQFASSAPINLAALMALRQKNPGLFGGMSQKDITNIAQAMMKWKQSQMGGQISFGGVQQQGQQLDPSYDPNAADIGLGY